MEEFENKSKKPICAHCGSRKIVLLNHRKMESKSLETYKCRDCTEVFVLLKNVGKELVNFAHDFNELLLHQYKKPGKESKKHTQEWTAYNQAKTKEKEMFINILKELLDLLKVDYRVRRGNPNKNLHEMIFACAIKVYSGLASRRAISELEILRKAGYIETVPHFNTLLNYYSDPNMTVILKKLIELSALPLKQVEQDFAADASGFSTSVYSRWFDYKWNEKKDQRVWVKCHAISGVKTNIISSVEVTPKNIADTSMFPNLVNDTHKNFEVREISADKAYSSRKNLQLVSDIGAIPYIPFKSNTTGKKTKVRIWKKMYEYFVLNNEEFMKKYHKRSNAETVFHMLKSKFGNNLKSKKGTAMINEVLVKCFCHNICVLIQEIHEIGLEVNLEGEKVKIIV